MIPAVFIYMAMRAGLKAAEYLAAAHDQRNTQLALEREQKEREESTRRHAQAAALADAQRREREVRQASARRAAEEAAAAGEARRAREAREAQDSDRRARETTIIRNTLPADPLGDYLSYSRLRAFHECPHKFRLKYILGRTGDESRMRVGSGKMFHEWLELVLTPHQGRRFPHAVLKQAPTEHRQRALTLAARINEGCELVAIEQEVRYSIGGVPVLRYIDILYREPGGTLVICDVKTGKTPKIHIEQLEMYAIQLLEKERGIRLEYHLVDCGELVWWRVGAQQRQQLWSDLRDNAAAIRSERAFAPIPGGHCSSCQFYDECDHAGRSRGKPSELRLVQLRTAKRGAKQRESEYGQHYQ